MEVLERMKGLLLLPALEMATTQQVADFYEVDRTVIYQISNRHKDELLSDGYCKMTGKDLRNFSGFDTMSNAKMTDKVNHILIEHGGVETKLSNSVNTFFPKRAILRVGMLLRDSVVAKEVRTQLFPMATQPKMVKN
ncbi:hypothetical protein [Lysinibacillus sp. PWR01]|uniref:hypothetical protein n=1 Tax=Lysinibacillus sp. PWR01 TaxID=3342384 RepID=UPI00372D5A83